MLKTSQPCCFLKFSHHTKNEKILILILMIYLERIQHLHKTHDIYTKRKYIRVYASKHSTNQTFQPFLVYLYYNATWKSTTRWWSPVFCLIRFLCMQRTLALFSSRKKHLNSSLFILYYITTEVRIHTNEREECIIMWRVYKRLQLRLDVCILYIKYKKSRNVVQVQMLRKKKLVWGVREKLHRYPYSLP